MKNEKEVGITIRKLRGNMSLRDFAKKCDISHTTIDNLEKGIDFRTGKPVQAKITTLQKIADACGVPLAYIVDEDEQPTLDDELKIALFGIGTEVTDEMWDKVVDYAKLIKAQHEREIKEIYKNMETAARLRLAMKKKDILTPSLSLETQIEGITIANYIDGKTLPTEEDASKLASALDISREWLMCRDNLMPLEVALRKDKLEDKKWEELIEYAKILGFGPRDPKIIPQSDTIFVYQAAYSEDHHRDRYIEKDKEKHNQIKRTPNTDETLL